MRTNGNPNPITEARLSLVSIAIVAILWGRRPLSFRGLRGLTQGLCHQLIKYLEFASRANVAGQFGIGPWYSFNVNHHPETEFFKDGPEIQFTLVNPFNFLFTQIAYNHDLRPFAAGECGAVIRI